MKPMELPYEGRWNSANALCTFDVCCLLKLHLRLTDTCMCVCTRVAGACACMCDWWYLGLLSVTYIFWGWTWHFGFSGWGPCLIFRSWSRMGWVQVLIQNLLLGPWPSQVLAMYINCNGLGHCFNPRPDKSRHLLCTGPNQAHCLCHF